MSFLGIKHLLKQKELFTNPLQFNNPLMIYFSASWCPPCRIFTPKLTQFYNENRKISNDLEIILATLDENEQSYIDYYSKMPWLSVPYSETSALRKLTEKYKVVTIPSLLLVNEAGEVLYNDCRAQIEKDPNSAYSFFSKLLKDSQKRKAN